MVCSFSMPRNLAHLINYTAYEVSTSITQEPGQGSKDQNVNLIQVLGNYFGGLMGVTYANTCFAKWSWNSKMLVQGGLYAGEINMWEIQGAVATIGCRGAFDKPPSCCKQHMQVLMDCLIWLAIPGTKSTPAIRTEYGHSPDVLHLYGICSEQWPNVPLGLQKAANPCSCP